MKFFKHNFVVLFNFKKFVKMKNDNFSKKITKSEIFFLFQTNWFYFIIYFLYQRKNDRTFPSGWNSTISSKK